jgi:glyoxylase-like metal-dependent hydrolase (beta-lactamase superfamily II)
VNSVIDGLLEFTGRHLGGLRLSADAVAPGILRVRLSSRATRVNGMEVAVYLVGSVLIDSGFVHAGAALVPFFAERELSAICLTHHHEDHSGTCGALAVRHRCPVYLRNATRRFEEGLADLKPYRRLWWGEPLPYEPLEMPTAIATGADELRPVPIPGHSVTHTALYAGASGAVFTGDLFISRGATAVMSYENPFESIASLRRVADIEPRWMFTGHGLAVEAPAAALRRKADAIGQAAARVAELHAEGLPEAEVVRRVFTTGRVGDRMIDLFTGGEFSRTCFVRGCLRHAPTAMKE